MAVQQIEAGSTTVTQPIETKTETKQIEGKS